MVYLTRKAEFSASHYYHNPDFTPEEKDFLHLWGGLWIAILLLLMAIIFLAAWDLWAIRLYSVREHRKIQADRRAMIERQAARMRRQRNGFDG